MLTCIVEGGVLFWMEGFNDVLLQQTLFPDSINCHERKQQQSAPLPLLETTKTTITVKNEFLFSCDCLELQRTNLIKTWCLLLLLVVWLGCGACGARRRVGRVCCVPCSSEVRIN